MAKRGWMSSCRTDPIGMARRATVLAVALAAMGPVVPTPAAAEERLPPNALDLGAMLVLEQAADAIDRVVIRIVLSFATEADAQSARATLAQLRLRDAASDVLRDVRRLDPSDLDRLERRLVAGLGPRADNLRYVAVEILGRTSTRRD